MGITLYPPGTSAICTKIVKNLDAHLCNLPIDKLDFICYNKYVRLREKAAGRKLKSRTNRPRRQGAHDADKKDALKNLFKKNKKPLDNRHKVWYNIDTEGKGEGTH